MPQTCILCGCTSPEGRPCLGGTTWPSLLTEDRSDWNEHYPHRLVPDASILAPGTTCHWAVDLGEVTVCSAHTLAEAERVAGILDPDEATYGRPERGHFP